MLKNVNLESIFEIESILHACYRPNGNKLALIKSNKTINSFISNETKSIINSISINNDPITSYLLNLTKQHCKNNGDNCKIFYFYVCELLRYIKNSNNNNEIASLFRFISLNDIYELITSKLGSDFGNENLIKVKYDEIIKIHLKQFNVFNDLNYSKLINCVINNLISELLKSEYDNYKVNKSLNNHIDHLKYIVFYSNKSINTNDSAVFTNGFIIDKKFILNNIPTINCNKLKAVILVNDVINDTNVNYNLRLNNNSNMFNSSFTQLFMETLKNNDINLILTSNSLNEWQKSQLNKLNCSLISYIDKEYLDYLCDQLNIFAISSCSNTNLKDFCEKRHVIYIESYNYIDKCSDSLIFFKLNEEKHIKLTFVHIYIPLDSMKEQINNHFFKVLKTFKCFSLNDFNLIIKNFKFESILNMLFEDTYKNSNNKLEIYSHLAKIMRNLDRKLNKQTFKNELDNSLEPFDLKLKSFMNALVFMKTITNTNEIISSKLLKNTQNLSDNEDDN